MSDLDANFDNQLAAFMGGEKVEEVKEPETVETVSQEETITEPVKPAEPTTADKAKALGWNPDKDEFEAKTGKEWPRRVRSGQLLANTCVNVRWPMKFTNVAKN